MNKKVIALVAALLVIIGVLFYTITKRETPAPVTYGGTTTVGSLYAPEGGVRQGGLIATSTGATTYTLVAADVVSLQTMVLTPTVGTLTLTLPASTTLQALVPNVGDEYNFSIFNGTTTSGQKITLVKTLSAGVNVVNASSSLDILPQGMMWIDLTRTTNSTTTVELVPAI